MKDLRSSFAASYVSPLNERTAILLLPSLMGHWMGGETDGGRGSGFGGWTKVLEVLHKGSFQLCGVKVVMMSKDSAREIKIMCSADISVSLLYELLYRYCCLWWWLLMKINFCSSNFVSISIPVSGCVLISYEFVVRLHAEKEIIFFHCWVCTSEVVKFMWCM